ncbi:MAG TPA: sialidase family protein [Gemmatimonadaceae bacterium]|nr:sialidase family protein [Gemmatimonadaceae bacterium]
MLRAKRHLERLIIGTASALAISAPLAGAQILEVGPNVLAMAAPAWGALVEPHLAAHPTMPGHLVAAVMVADTAGAPSPEAHCATLLSTDGGRTWASERQPLVSCADPWVTVTGSGEVVFAGLGMHAVVGWPGAMGLVVARSPDGGRTWNDTLVGLGRGHDRETMVADPRPDARRSVVLFSGLGLKLDDGPLRWSVYIARSVDAARTFREPVKVLPSNLNLNAEEGVVLHDGTILASFVDFQRNVDNFRGRDGMLQRRRIWMLRSTDDGRTFSPPLFVTEHCGRSAYDVAADASAGPARGRVFLVCRTLDGGGILIHHSNDRGETWSAPRLVSADTAGAFRTQPRLAVNRSGTVAVAWLDGGRDTSGACYRVMIAVSRDGGASFAAPAAVSPRTCPDVARNGFAMRRWPQGGDYFGLVAAADGRFHAMWTDARRGPFELFTASVAVR